MIDARAGLDLVETRRGVTAMIGHFGGMYPVEYRGDSGWWDLGVQRVTRTIVILPQEVILLFDHLEHSTDLVHMRASSQQQARSLWVAQQEPSPHQTEICGQSTLQMWRQAQVDIQDVNT